MSKFMASCIDSVTGKEMVLSEASYNNACAFLESQVGEIMSAVMSGNLVKIICKGIKRTFYYDECRGYLLGD